MNDKVEGYEGCNPMSQEKECMQTRHLHHLKGMYGHQQPCMFDLRDIDIDNGEYGPKLDDIFEYVDKEEDEKLLSSLFSIRHSGQ